MLNKKVVAIIQARMGSTRLPGKVMKEIGGKPILGIIVSRLKNSKHLDEIVIATSTNPDDNIIEVFAKQMGLKYYRGSEENVLKRYIEAAELFKADLIVRVTADNPLTDPKLVDELIKIHIKNGSNYTFCDNVPVGVSAEIVDMSSLKIANANSKLTSEKEHVTTYIKSNPELFKIQNANYRLNNKNFRLTVDTEIDLELIRRIYAELGPIEDLKLEKVVEFLENNPEVSNLDKSQIINHGLKELKITVIIRTHNSEKFVKKAIESVLNQTLSQDLIEILVLDDNSIDNTKKILKQYGDNIRVIEGKWGPIKAINVGIEKSKGKYVILLDSDDQFELNALEEFLNFVTFQNLDFAYSDYNEFNIETNEMKIVSLKDNIFDSVAGGIIFKRSVLKELGGYDENLFFPEYDLLIKAKEKDLKHGHIDKPLFTYLRHGKSLTADTISVQEGYNQLLKKYGSIKGLKKY